MLHRILKKTILGVCISMITVSMAIATAKAQVKSRDVITPENAIKIQSDFAHRTLSHCELRSGMKIFYRRGR